MRLVGYCTVCHRVKQVRVSGHQLAMAKGKAPQGICDACQDEEDKRAQERRR